MAVKRTGSVSTEISKLDRRITTVENKTVSGIASGVTTTVPDDEGSFGGPGQTGDAPPYSYRKVIKAYIYGSKVTGGNGSRLELYFAEDPEIAPGAFVRIQGLHGTSTDNFELSPKNFKVLATDTPPWTDADYRGEGVDGQLRRSWRDTPSTGTNGETVTHTVFFNPVVEVPKTYSSTSGRELITTRRIDTISVSGSTVTVNLNSTHLFEVGDVIYIDAITGYASLFGIDGLFKVSNVVSDTVIEYQLDAPVSIPFSLTNTQVGTKYVYPVAQTFVEEGTIWTDTSVEPNRVYVWKDYRWYDTADPIGTVTAEQDGIAPSPVTDLEGESSLPSGSTTPVIDLTWVPPTTRSNGASLSGFLSGYEIRYKRSTAPTWETKFIPDGGDGISSYRITEGLEQNKVYNIEVYVVDIMSQRSTAATVNVTTAKYSETLYAPSTPTVSSKLGTITVTWDGLDSTGNLPVPGIIYIEFHESTTSGFTPSSSTLVETLPITNSGNYVVLTERLFDDTTTYYYKTRFVRQISPTELETSAASTQSAGQKVVGVTGPDIVAGSVTTNKLEAGFVTASLVRGDVIRAGASSSSPRVELRSTGIAAFNGVSGDPATFTVSSSDGSVTITGGTLTAPNVVGGIIQTTATAERGIKLTSSNLIAYNSSGVKTFSVDTSNGDVYIAGGMTIGDIDAVQSDVDGVKTNIYFPGTTQINGGSIRTGTVTADQLTATAIDGKTITGSVVRSNSGLPRVEMNTNGIFCFDSSGNAPFRAYANGTVFMTEGYTGTLSADNITSGTLTGRSIQTASSGKRILLSNSSNSAVFYDDNGTLVGRVQGVTTGSGSLDLTGRGTASINIGVASTVVDGNLSTAGTANIFAAGRLGQQLWALTGTRIGGVSYNDTGLLVPSASDQRLKTNIEQIPSALEKLLQLNPVTFNWKTDESNPAKIPGLVAQEVSEVFAESDVQIVRRLPDPNADPESEFYSDPMMAVEYEAIVPYLIKAVQELSQQNSELQARIAALEGN